MPSKLATPQKTFDDQLERLVQHLKGQKLSLPGIDTKTLEADLKAQRDEKQADVERKARYEAEHRRFLEAQAERYARYNKAVRILRATHWDDPANLKELAQFKRPRGSKSPAPAADPSPSVAAGKKTSGRKKP